MALCQVCGIDLSSIHAKHYYQRKKVCPEHLQAPAVVLPGQVGLHRFCFQCGKFQPLICFEGKHRSCRERLCKRRKTCAVNRQHEELLPLDSSCTTYMQDMPASGVCAGSLGWTLLSPETPAALDFCMCGSYDPLTLAIPQDMQRELALLCTPYASAAQTCAWTAQQQLEQQQQPPVVSMDEGNDLDHFLEEAIEQELRSRLAQQPLSPGVGPQPLQLSAGSSGCGDCGCCQLTSAAQSDIEAMIEQTFMSVAAQGGAEGTAESLSEWAEAEADGSLPSSPVRSSSLLPAMPPTAARVNHQTTTMMEASQVVLQQVPAAAASYADHTAVKREQLLLQAEMLLQEELLLRQAYSSTSTAAAFNTPQVTTGGVTPSWGTSRPEFLARADGGQAELVREVPYLDPAVAAATFQAAVFATPQPSSRPQREGSVTGVRPGRRCTTPTRLRNLQEQACAAASQLHDLQMWVDVLLHDCNTHTCA